MPILASIDNREPFESDYSHAAPAATSEHEGETVVVIKQIAVVQVH